MWITCETDEMSVWCGVVIATAYCGGRPCEVGLGAAAVADAGDGAVADAAPPLDGGRRASCLAVCLSVRACGRGMYGCKSRQIRSHQIRSGG